MSQAAISDVFSERCSVGGAKWRVRAGIGEGAAENTHMTDTNKSFDGIKDADLRDNPAPASTVQKFEYSIGPLDRESLDYHRKTPRGKIEIVPTKPCLTQHDLALAYTPGVAAPCRAIRQNPEDAFLYTGRGNLVAVITNGTAVLGLGAIGALAGKPVMEGKALLFKRFADLDAIDLEIDTEDPDLFVQTVKLLEPSFGGINLEDIKAPECFYIEERLRRELRIPVFHDDQHGTAIISGAAFLNALEVTGKKVEKVRCVFIGAGAACIASANMFLQLGVKPENLIMTDIDGVLYKGRTASMNPYKERFARETPHRTLADAMKGADVVV